MSLDPLKDERHNFSNYVDKALWALLIASITYGASQVQSASLSIQTLNEKMAVVITQIGSQKEAITDHEQRIRALEIRRAVK